jgi:hypothetical protein
MMNISNSALTWLIDHYISEKWLEYKIKKLALLVLNFNFFPAAKFCKQALREKSRV